MTNDNLIIRGVIGHFLLMRINSYSQTKMVCEKLAWAGVGANGNSPLKERKLGMNSLPYLFVF